MTTLATLLPTSVLITVDGDRRPLPAPQTDAFASYSRTHLRTLVRTLELENGQQARRIEEQAEELRAADARVRDLVRRLRASHGK